MIFKNGKEKGRERRQGRRQGRRKEDKRNRKPGEKKNIKRKKEKKLKTKTVQDFYILDLLPHKIHRMLLKLKHYLKPFCFVHL